MKRITITLLIAFISLFTQAQNYNPFVAQGIVSPSPIDRLEMSGTGQVSFLIGNSGDDALPIVAGQEILLTVILSGGVPNNANPLSAIGGTFASYFTWQYNVTTKTYLGTQNTSIPDALNGGVGDITIAYKVSSNSLATNPQNGFSVNLTPPAYSNGINTISDDQVSSYTWTKEQFNTDPDITGTLINVSVSGNVSTNDDVPVGTTYGNPISDPSNPSACVPVMSSTGSYTFICSTPGEYEYQIPVCAPGQTSNCPTELLKITITDPGVVTAGPSVNPDVMTTLQNMPTTLNVLSNDACNNGPSCTLSNPTITDQPNNGTVVVNANGTLTYTPNSTFVGTDTIMYAACDNQSPSKCDTTFIIVSVNPTGAANTTSANEDYVNAKGNAPVSGNVLANDTDPEGNTQTVAPQNITNSQGTLVLNANGTYTFTAAAGYSGSVQFTYTVCDNGTPSACDTATLHILVLPPDVTINLTMTPNVMLGITTFNATVKVTELNSVNTNGTITVRIPKDSRVTFTYNSALTTVGFASVNNSVWTYNGTNPFFHLFTTTSVITAGGSSTFGFVGSFNPLNTNGKYTMTSTISSGSGSERKTTNNNDSESVDYFHN